MMSLKPQIPNIHLSKDENYQFCNRIAFSWKLASIGVPVVLVYLGFLGDERIAQGQQDQIPTDEDWQRIICAKTQNNFPSAMWEKEIICGAASFWLLVKSLNVLLQSPLIEKRRAMK